MTTDNQSKVLKRCFSFTIALAVLCSTATAQGLAKRLGLSVKQKAVFPPLSSVDQDVKRHLLESLPAPTSERRPNIVLLLADDLGYADIGCYDSTAIPTPNIDQLANRGIRFTDAYVTAGTCSPSRAALLSGRYQQKFGFEFNTGSRQLTERVGRGLDPVAITVADMMQQAGYRTAAIGKWHLGSRPQFHPQERGFDEFFGFLAGAHNFIDPKNLSPDEREISGPGASGWIVRGTDTVDEQEYLTDAFAREAVSFIERNKDELFFLYVPFNAVHTPIQATEQYRQRFANVSDFKRRTYYAMTSAMDDAVGTIVEALETNHVLDNTLVIFFNDNGGPTYTGVQDNGPLRLGKMYLFEGGIRVPLIIAGPGISKEPDTCNEMISALDFFPTLCGLGGVQPPAELNLDGENLLPLLRGEESSLKRDTLFWRNGSNRAIRQGAWKMITAGDHTWLFDLSTDLGEQNNVAQEHPEIVEQLEADLLDWESELSDPAWPPRPGEKTATVDGVPYRIEL